MNRRRFLGMFAALGAISGCASKFRTYSGPEVTRVLIFKSDRSMYLMHDDTALKAYSVALGGNPVGPKQFEGDGKTPEGLYFVDLRNPDSDYHLSLRISYPNDADKAFAKAEGKPPGGDIFIHGRDGKNRGRGRDWTAGCIAVKDREMEDVYAMVRTGTPVYLYP